MKILRRLVLSLAALVYYRIWNTELLSVGCRSEHRRLSSANREQGHYLNTVFFQNNAVPHVLELEKYAVNMPQIFVNMRLILVTDFIVSWG